jgi:hypothetical protein
LNYSVRWTYNVLMLPVCWGVEYWTVVDIGLQDVSLAILRFVAGKCVCKMITNSSFCWFCCMVSVTVWFCLHFRIHVNFSECAMRMLRLGYMFWCILCVGNFVFLLSFQFDQHKNYYRFCILIYICRYSLFYLVVFCSGVGCIWRC